MEGSHKLESCSAEVRVIDRKRVAVEALTPGGFADVKMGARCRFGAMENRSAEGSHPVEIAHLRGLDRALVALGTKEESMLLNYKLALALLTGVALGAGAIQALHAQTKPPVYAIVDFSEITDAAGFAAIGGRTSAAAAADIVNFGGHFLARTESITGLDGTPPKRFVIIAFDSPDTAHGWYNSPAQKDVTAIRVKTTKSRVFTVQGE